MECALRRERSALTLSGIGAMLLGIWAFVRIILSNLFAANYLQYAFDFDSSAPEMKVVSLALWILGGFLGMLLDLRVGIRAAREGKTGIRQRGYLPLAVVLLAANSLMFLVSLVSYSGSRVSVLDFVGEVVQAFARAANYAVLLRAAWQVRKLSGMREREVASHAD